eukprot:TRINITY_DN64014_c0_g1_i1.p1 TRINITY_DN64014_c0_g1~~TRINITY_DN64014_c0_g1_i1.p1  ORF type:complete len:673 (-),score=79.10 TRINITY_DN64014_c0_g1_i1:491-2509(-)
MKGRVYIGLCLSHCISSVFAETLPLKAGSQARESYRNPASDSVNVYLNRNTSARPLVLVDSQGIDDIDLDNLTNEIFDFIQAGQNLVSSPTVASAGTALKAIVPLLKVAGVLSGCPVCASALIIAGGLLQKFGGEQGGGSDSAGVAQKPSDAAIMHKIDEGFKLIKLRLDAMGQILDRVQREVHSVYRDVHLGEQQLREIDGAYRAFIEKLAAASTDASDLPDAKRYAELQSDKLSAYAIYFSQENVRRLLQSATSPGGSGGLLDLPSGALLYRWLLDVRFELFTLQFSAQVFKHGKVDALAARYAHSLHADISGYNVTCTDMELPIAQNASALVAKQLTCATARAAAEAIKRDSEKASTLEGPAFMTLLAKSCCDFQGIGACPCPPTSMDGDVETHAAAMCARGVVRPLHGMKSILVVESQPHRGLCLNAWSGTGHWATRLVAYDCMSSGEQYDPNGVWDLHKDGTFRMAAGSLRGECMALEEGACTESHSLVTGKNVGDIIVSECQRGNVTETSEGPNHGMNDDGNSTFVLRDDGTVYCPKCDKCWHWWEGYEWDVRKWNLWWLIKYEVLVNLGPCDPVYGALRVSWQPLLAQPLVAIAERELLASNGRTGKLFLHAYRTLCMAPAKLIVMAFLISICFALASVARRCFRQQAEDRARGLAASLLEDTCS